MNRLNTIVSSTAPFKRSRTKSSYEEKNVQEFIDATVDFDSQITFYPRRSTASNDEESLHPYILLVGTQAQLSDEAQLSQILFSLWGSSSSGDLVRATISEARERGAGNGGGIIWTTIMVKNSFGGSGGGATVARRFGVAVISSVASRMNCPTRPDLITAAVSEATKAAAGKPLDIFVCSNDEVLIATSIARGATRPFTAKAGRAELKYVHTAPPVRVFYPSPALKTKPEHLAAVANYTQISMRLIDAPTNLLDTTSFPEIASRLRAKLGFDFSIIQGEELREQGFGGIYGVGKAAEFPPALVTLHYKPKNKTSGGITNKDKIALVGKGIVYDTGGLAIKWPGPTTMRSMKKDMGGSAIVFGGFLSAVALEADREIVCVLCLADNAIGPLAQRNDDIVRLKSGLTTEINNTDAEGRLVLADGIWLAAQHQPSLIIDMATLTNAQGVATGIKHGGLYTPSSQVEQKFVAAGLKTGDLLMPLVYAPEYHNTEFSSKVADHLNHVRNGMNAGSSCAGQFIFNNVPREYRGDLAHIDLCWPCWDGEQATGYGIGLLVEILTK